MSVGDSEQLTINNNPILYSEGLTYMIEPNTNKIEITGSNGSEATLEILAGCEPGNYTVIIANDGKTYTVDLTVNE